MQCCQPLGGNLQRFSECNFNDGPDRIKEDIARIREWQQKQTHLCFTVDDQLILAFLRCSKFSIERTKEKIDNYYTMRTLVPEVLCNRDPFSTEIQAVLNAGVILPLPKPLNDDGPRIIMFTYGSNLNPDTMSFSNVAKVIYMVLDILIKEDDRSVVSGIKTWSICKNIPSKYVIQVTPPLVKKYLTIVQNGFPIRIKELFVTECSPLFQYAYDISKLFLSKKLSERVCMVQVGKASPSNNNFRCLYMHMEWKAKVESYRDWFLENEKLKSNEDLRKGTSKTSSSVFGMEGSFRKLNID
ncbi:hypothetical protein RI129_005471 [Pyrocoelia pectoralis]|uniref:CRAL/TRIO N-terminal domain-containing protein n=1 Tax=Pyrocoelia pectoralis TaxID=417401 RepID=A0AAN7VFP5_9COLE